MDNQISLSKKNNPDLQELVSDKGPGDTVKMTVTFRIAENSETRLTGSIDEVEGKETEPEAEDIPAVRVVKGAMKQDGEEEQE